MLDQDMRQVVGYVAPDGNYDPYFSSDREDRYSVERIEEGTYKISFDSPFNGYPIVNLTPISGYMTANAVVYQVSHAGDWITVKTGYTDKPSTEYMDCAFYFTVIGRV